VKEGLSVEELLAQLRAMFGEDSDMTPYDNLVTAIESQSVGFESELESRNNTIQALTDEVTKLKIMNYDLLTSVPKEETGESESEEIATDDNEEISFDDLFDKESN
jgi:hypothetical protein